MPSNRERTRNTIALLRAAEQHGVNFFSIGTKHDHFDDCTWQRKGEQSGPVISSIFVSSRDHRDHSEKAWGIARDAGFSCCGNTGQAQPGDLFHRGLWFNDPDIGWRSIEHREHFKFHRVTGDEPQEDLVMINKHTQEVLNACFAFGAKSVRIHTGKEPADVDFIMSFNTKEAMYLTLRCPVRGEIVYMFPQKSTEEETIFQKQYEIGVWIYDEEQKGWYNATALAAKVDKMLNAK